jgi:hypothetical protein
MRTELVASYKKRLIVFFRDTKAYLGSKEFGASQSVIHLSIPFMVLENWREDGHLDDIPLLGEAVKNLTFATAAFIFGWKKSCCLHLRVTLESIFSGIGIFNNRKAHIKFCRTGDVPYRRFSSILKDYSNHSKETQKICSAFPLLTEVSDLYAELSKWSHTSGASFVSDLSTLGFCENDPTSIGQIKGYYKKICKYSVIAYLSIKPNILHDISAANQRLLLQPLTIIERGTIRNIIGR